MLSKQTRRRPVHSRGLFEGVASQQAASVDLCLVSRAQATTASFLTLALWFRFIAETTLRMV